MNKSVEEQLKSLNKEDTSELETLYNSINSTGSIISTNLSSIQKMEKEIAVKQIELEKIKVKNEERQKEHEKYIEHLNAIKLSSQHRIELERSNIQEEISVINEEKLKITTELQELTEIHDEIKNRQSKFAHIIEKLNNRIEELADFNESLLKEETEVSTIITFLNTPSIVVDKNEITEKVNLINSDMKRIGLQIINRQNVNNELDHSIREIKYQQKKLHLKKNEIEKKKMRYEEELKATSSNVQSQILTKEKQSAKYQEQIVYNEGFMRGKVNCIPSLQTRISKFDLEIKDANENINALKQQIIERKEEVNKVEEEAALIKANIRISSQRHNNKSNCASLAFDDIQRKIKSANIEKEQFKKQLKQYQKKEIILNNRISKYELKNVKAKECERLIKEADTKINNHALQIRNQEQIGLLEYEEDLKELNKINRQIVSADEKERNLLSYRIPVPEIRPPSIKIDEKLVKEYENQIETNENIRKSIQRSKEYVLEYSRLIDRTNQDMAQIHRISRYLSTQKIIGEKEKDIDQVYHTRTYEQKNDYLEKTIEIRKKQLEEKKIRVANQREIYYKVIHNYGLTNLPVIVNAQKEEEDEISPNYKDLFTKIKTEMKFWNAYGVSYSAESLLKDWLQVISRIEINAKTGYS